MKGFSVAQEGHVVNVLPPVDITGGKTGQAFDMKNYASADIIVQIGVSAAAFTKILVNKCSDGAGTGATAIPFTLYKQETAGAGNDVLTDKNAIDTTGYTPSANDNIFYVVRVSAADLDASKHFVQLQLTNGVNSVIASAVAVLSGSRYANVQSASVTA
jgi:hypothetical protein